MTFLDDQRRASTKTLTGLELAALVLDLPGPRSSLVVRYVPQAR